MIVVVVIVRWPRLARARVSRGGGCVGAMRTVVYLARAWAPTHKTQLAQYLLVNKHTCVLYCDTAGVEVSKWLDHVFLALFRGSMSVAGKSPCQGCGETVWPADRQISVSERPWHMSCFKCAHCNGQVRPASPHASRGGGRGSAPPGTSARAQLTLSKFTMGGGKPYWCVRARPLWLCVAMCAWGWCARVRVRCLWARARVRDRCVCSMTLLRRRRAASRTSSSCSSRTAASTTSRPRRTRRVSWVRRRRSAPRPRPRPPQPPPRMLQLHPPRPQLQLRRLPRPAHRVRALIHARMRQDA